MGLRPRRRKARRRYPRSPEDEGEVAGVVLLSARYCDFDSNDLGEAQGSELEVSEDEDDMVLTFEDREEDASTPLEDFRISSESLELDALNREIDISLVPSVEKLLGNEASTDRDVDALSTGSEQKPEDEKGPGDAKGEDEEGGMSFVPEKSSAKSNEDQSHTSGNAADAPSRSEGQSLSNTECLPNASSVAAGDDRDSDDEQKTKL